MTTTQQARECIIGDINLDLFLAHVDPDWKEKFIRADDDKIYYASEDAFKSYTEFMTVNEIKTLVAEAGA